MEIRISGLIKETESLGSINNENNNKILELT